jgi:hypothetical protein
MTPDEAGAQVIEVAGETLWLLPEHAIWWPRAAMLMAADIHIGKAAAFRALGQPVPHGTTADNLARLLDLLAATRRETSCFWGFPPRPRGADCGRAAGPARLAPRNAIARALHAGAGNHDTHAGDPPETLGLRW